MAAKHKAAQSAKNRRKTSGITKIKGFTLPQQPTHENKKENGQTAAGMILSIGDITRSFGIIIISFCAVFVCTLFLNYNTDLKSIGAQTLQSDVQNLYNALVMTGKMVSILSGGCLLLTSAVMLCFYIRHYVDTHGKMLGILKAMGYPNLRIAAGFSGFGLSILIGSGAGYALAHVTMPQFYRMQNTDGLLPEIRIRFHPALFAALVIVPTIVFCLLSVLYGYFRLKTPVLDLLKGKVSTKIPKEAKDRENAKKSSLPFLQELKTSTRRQQKSLVFFVGFASFCYASMMQMSFGMDELASWMMALMIFLIGVVLSSVTLFLATTSAVKANWKTLALMRAFGYPDKACSNSILGGYRLPACIGFALGTVYQYALLKVAVMFVFAEVEHVPEYRFDVPALILTLISFTALYKIILHVYTEKIKRMSIREVMMGEE
ncbi:MAG: ABC transporter permease [Lachnospiraceae bacterium]|nr:ABC transporter permease [Lachnospiraceae bacterium]